MKKLVILALIAFFSWQGYKEYRSNQFALTDAVSDPSATSVQGGQPQLPKRTFKCDGRTYCSQMTSCEEAIFFLRNCPGVKMDGNHDGVPCEQQWCR